MQIFLKKGKREKSIYNIFIYLKIKLKSIPNE